MLEWYVYVNNPNSKRIEDFNIFDHRAFLADCVGNKIKNGNDRLAFVDQLRKDLLYYFWSKCEWEVVIESWPSGYGERKVDVYSQVMMNFASFCDYVWEHKDLLKNGRKR